jgi:hypothetical protein
VRDWREEVRRRRRRRLFCSCHDGESRGWGAAWRTSGVASRRARVDDAEERSEEREWQRPDEREN